MASEYSAGEMSLNPFQGTENAESPVKQALLGWPKRWGIGTRLGGLALSGCYRTAGALSKWNQQAREKMASPGGFEPPLPP